MARYFPDTADDYLNKAFAATPEPITLCCWFNPDNVTEYHPLVDIGNGGLNYYLLSARGDEGGDPVFADERVSLATHLWDTKTAFVASSWQHGAAVFKTNYRLAYLDGVSSGSPHTGVQSDPSGMDRIEIGRVNIFLSSNAFCRGSIAEVAVWGRELPGAAITDMATGKSALYYPTDLLFYARLLADEDYDEISETNLSVFGSPGTSAHPPMDYPDVTAPSNLVCDVASSVQINLSWVDISSDEVGFKIERSTDNIFWNQIAIVGANVTTYEDTGLTPNETYYYRVRAYK